MSEAGAHPDAVVVGAGPNGLGAAIELAGHGLNVWVLEANATVGGGMRTAELTLPGYGHDLCSAVHPMGRVSPFFQSLDLARHGLEWIHPDAPLAHPLTPDRAVLLEDSLQETTRGLARDGRAWSRLFAPFLPHWQQLVPHLMAPLVRVPRRPALLGRFGLRALRSAASLVRGMKDDAAPALLAGIAAHGVLPLDQVASGAVAMVLGLAGQGTGWPIPRGGSQRIADALVAELEARGGQVLTERPVSRLEDLPPSSAVLLDLTPRQVLEVAGPQLPDRYRRALVRFRYAPGVFKMDWALSDPIPWSDPVCARAATVHVGGMFADVARAEAAAHGGEVPETPFVLLAQPSLFDPTRAPEGRHTAWAYCRVPHGSDVDMTEAIESRIEMFAPGFRDVIVGRSVRAPRDLQAGNANLVGGDVGGGLQDLAQTVFRPVPALDPYRTPLPDVYLCSSSTPPGGGVHGMCGFHAARSALRHSFGVVPG